MNWNLKQPVLWSALALLFGFAAVAQNSDPAEVALGERLFLETRFAQFFFTTSGGNVNTNLPVGDPALAATVTTGAPLAGPFAGQLARVRLSDDDVSALAAFLRSLNEDYE